MSKEAVGQNGERIGSLAYWNKLNKSSVLSEVMHPNTPTDYYNAIRKAGERASNAIDMIYQDVSKKQGELRYISSAERNTLVKQIKGLYDVCKLTGKPVMHSDACIHALSSDGGRGFRDERAIEESVKYIKNNHHYSAWESRDMVKEAAEWGISHAARRDPKKEAFLKTVAQNKGEDFLKEVLKEYEHRQGNCDCRGQCGYAIGSSGYLDWVEANFIAGSLPMTSSARWGSPNYALLFQDALKSVAEQLERDLDAADRSGDYITESTKTQLKAAVAELSRCGVSTHRLNDKIDKLAWFVGGDKDKIKELQHLLNEQLGGHIEEDGVYGQETKTAEKILADRISNANEYLKNSENLKNLDLLCKLYLTWPTYENIVKAAILANRKEIQRAIWLFLAVPALRLAGLELTAEFLAHAAERNPSDLRYSQSSPQAKLIKESIAVQNGIAAELSKIRESEAVTGEGAFEANFYDSGEKDFLLSVGTSMVHYSYCKADERITFSCVLSDDYNFDALRIIAAEDGNVALRFSIPNLANDIGLLSQADGALKKYHYTMAFTVAKPFD